MKSTVLMRAISSETRYTVASSHVSIPTSRLGSFDGFMISSASDRAVGPILAAHPQVRESAVNVFFFSKKAIFSSEEVVYNHSTLIGLALTIPVPIDYV